MEISISIPGNTPWEKPHFILPGDQEVNLGTPMDVDPPLGAFSWIWSVGRSEGKTESQGYNCSLLKHRLHDLCASLSTDNSIVALARTSRGRSAICNTDDPAD